MNNRLCICGHRIDLHKKEAIGCPFCNCENKALDEEIYTKRPINL